MKTQTRFLYQNEELYNSQSSQLHKVQLVTSL